MDNCVHTFLRSIPRGRVTTYADVARFCGIRNPRLVSRVLRDHDDSDTIPCYKVVRSDGTIADGYLFGGREAQRRRLVKDGITVSKQGRIENFSAVVWRGGEK